MHEGAAKVIDEIRSRPGFYIVQGPNGIGKRSLLLKQISRDSHQIIEPDGKSIKVESVKNIAQTLSLKRDGSHYIVIDRAETLTEHAQNALLKTLEELPQNIGIIMITAFSERLLPTVRSRATIRTISRPSEEEVMQWLESKISSEEAQQLIEGIGPYPGQLQLYISDEAEKSQYQANRQTVLELLEAPKLSQRLHAAAQLTENLENALSLSSRLARYNLRQNSTKFWLEVCLACEYANTLFFANCNKKLVLDSIAMRLYR